MRNTILYLTAAVFVTTLVAACQVDQAPEPVARASVGQSNDALTFITSGKTVPRIFAALVGKGLNGRRLTGELLDGRWIESVSLDDVVVKGHTTSLRLNGTALRRGRGIASRFWQRPSHHVIGALLNATLDDGSEITLRIDGFEPSEEPGFEDVYYYTVSYQTEDAWEPLCGVDDDGEPIPAVPLSGEWNYEEGVSGGGAHVEHEGAITFGCRGYVLAKCVEMGYRPWLEGLACEDDSPGRAHCERLSLQGHHQACTRMLRADYCGDGTSYTNDGTYINAYDDLELRFDSEDWLFEAEWDADGAICVSRERLNPPMLPHCFEALLEDGCGDLEHFAEGTLIMSETEPPIAVEE